MKKLSEYSLPIQNFMEYSDCMQATMYSVIYNNGYRFDMLPFITFANFSFLPNNDILSQCFERKGEIPGIPDRLSELTGINVIRKDFQSKKQIFDLCRINTQNQIPTVLNLDAYEISYHLNYKKNHYGHYVIILLLSEDGRCVYQDPYFNINRSETLFNSLPIYEKHCFYYMEDYGSTSKLQRIVLKEVEQYKCNKYVIQMENICTLLTSDHIFSNEITLYQVPALAPLMVKLKSLITDRLNLLNCLRKYPPDVKDMIDELELCFKDWNDTYLVLLKSITRNFSKIIIEKACELLMKAIKREEKIVSNLSNAIKHNNYLSQY